MYGELSGSEKILRTAIAVVLGIEDEFKSQWTAHRP
jgi:hypothetical protein